MRFNPLPEVARLPRLPRPTLLWHAAGWALLGLCSACSTVIEVRPLATGRVDVSAFELRGPTVPAFRDQASQLCPQGAEVLRQSARDQVALVDPGRINLWLNTASSWFEPPLREAQLMIVCKPAPGDAQLQAVVSSATRDVPATPAAAADPPTPSH